MLGFIVTFVAFTALAALILSARDRRRKRREEERLFMEQRREAAEQARQYAALAEQRARAEEEMRARRAARIQQLTGRFGEEITEKILKREIWQGATAEMLIEARGNPDDIEERVMAKKTRHIYKYDRAGKNRYRLRITLENGIVVGWEDKGGDA